MQTKGGWQSTNETTDKIFAYLNRTSCNNKLYSESIVIESGWQNHHGNDNVATKSIFLHVNQVITHSIHCCEKQHSGVRVGTLWVCSSGQNLRWVLTLIICDMKFPTKAKHVFTQLLRKWCDLSAVICCLMPLTWIRVAESHLFQPNVSMGSVIVNWPHWIILRAPKSTDAHNFA